MTALQAPYRVREHPFSMVVLLGATAVSVILGTLLAWTQGAPTYVVGILVATDVLILATVAAFSTLNLRVEAEELTVSWGGLLWKRLHAEEIVRAETGTYSALPFGGWGWRLSWRGDTAFSYLGSAGTLIVHRTNGRTLVVTLRDPAAAAAAVNAIACGSPAAAR